jgi:hypothetical protein
MARPNDSSRRDQPDTQWLERMYNNLRRVPDHGDYFARWAAESALVRRSLPCQLDLPYGDAAGETLDAFPAERPRSPIVVFIHGGYWKAMDKSQHSFVVPALRALGVRAADGGRLADHGAASILLPAGVRGAAFMIFPNFHVIEKYNAADAYVIGIGHLSDRIRGGGPIRAAWPRDDRALVLAERVELQERLTAAGFDTGGADGKIGPRTVAAVKAFQRTIGMVPDGYASLEILKRLR